MRRTRVALVALALLIACAVPGVAQARVSEYQVQYTPRSSGGLGQLIVNVVLSPETPLPAVVNVPLPLGATVQWSGEILGGAPEEDPFREASVVTSGTAQVATFTLQQVRVAQVEAQMGPPTMTGDAISSSLAWINAAEEGPYTFSVVLEANAGDVTIKPAATGEPARNEAGETLYTLAPVRLKAGQPFEVGVSYSLGGSDEGAAGGSRTAVIVVVALVAIVAALALLRILLTRERRAGAPAGPGEPSHPEAVRSQPPTQPRAADSAVPDGVSVLQDRSTLTGSEGDFFTFD